MGLVYFQSGRRVRASSNWKRLKGSNPRDAGLSFDLALAYFRTKQFQKSLQTLQIGEEPQARTADYYALLGSNFLQLNDAPKTLENLRKAVAMDPKNPEYAYDLGFALNKNGSHRRGPRPAEESPDEVSAERENCSGSRDELARVGEFRRSGASFQKALQLEPDAAEISLALGELYSSQGQFEKAQEAFACAIRLEPGNGLSHYKQGVNLLKLQFSEQAADEFRQALSLDPQLADAHYQLGKLAAASGQVRKPWPT